MNPINKFNIGFYIIAYFREEVKEMFYHSYNSYLKYAYPYDELRPLSCDGIDTYGRYYLILINNSILK